SSESAPRSSMKRDSSVTSPGSASSLSATTSLIFSSISCSSTVFLLGSTPRDHPCCAEVWRDSSTGPTRARRASCGHVRGRREALGLLRRGAGEALQTLMHDHPTVNRNG